MGLRDQWATWLGPAADTITDEQLNRLDDVARRLDNRWPDDDPDHAEDRTTALAAAAQVILGDATLEQVGAQLQAVRRAEHEQLVALTGALLASDGGERVLAERAGVARDTVRKALGR